MSRLIKCSPLLITFMIAPWLQSCGGGGSTDNSDASGFDNIEFDPAEVRSGGDTTVFNTTVEAFSKPSSNLTTSRKGDFFVGNDFFTDPWVQAPASTTSRDGLGPLFNVSACQSCHIKDGRGHAPVGPEDSADSLLIRLARPPLSATEQAYLDDPATEKLSPENYGGQLQDRSILDVPAEGSIEVTWTPEVVTFSDGTTMELRRPSYTVTNLAYGDMHPDTVLSPRVSPPMIGLGLLEAIAESDIVAQEDPDDSNGDGISGRANRVFDVVTTADSEGITSIAIGRFGWKAGQPSLMAQNSGAFNGDIGITSDLRPAEQCTTSQEACNNAPSGVSEFETAEVSEAILKSVEFYTQNLAVPARRNADDEIVLEGKRLFMAAGCAQCHTPRYTTAAQPDERRELSEQTIFPYTDLLLHDMGDDLADRTVDGSLPTDFKSEFLASTREWRTPPLWGIGLSKTVSEEATFLHDGRARTVMEAVLWHGGEAAASREEVINMNAMERDALNAFLQSL